MAEVFDFGLQQHKIKMDGKFFENDLFAVAGDTGRRLELQLLNSDNLVQDTTGISLRLNGYVDGQATYAEATLVDVTRGLYQLDLPNGMLMAPGDWQFQWQIIGTSGEKLHSFAFMGSIGSNLSEGGTEATNFYLNTEELRLKTIELENRYQAMINEFTNKDIVSAPEIIEARTDLDSTVHLSLKLKNDAFESKIKLYHQANDLKLSSYEVIFSDIDESLKKIADDIKDYGAVGDGVSNDTIAVKDFLSTGGNLVVSEGIYMIEADFYPIASNTHLKFLNGSKFKLLPHNASNYSMLQTKDVDNVTVINAWLDGSKSENSSSTGEWGHGVDILNSDNIVFERPTIVNTWGDGIYFGHDYFGTSEKKIGKVLISDAFVDGARRNGISACSSSNTTVLRPHIKNIRGVNPMAGIDIEPEGEGTVKPFISNLTIVDPVIENCAAGIYTLLTQLSDRGLSSNIQISNPVFKECDVPISFGSCKGLLGGSINFSNVQAEKSKLGVIRMENYNAVNTPHITIDGIDINGFNVTNSTNEFYNHVFTFFADASFTSLFDVGNMTINNPTITDDSNATFKFIYSNIGAKGNKLVKNVSIINPELKTTKERTSTIFGKNGINLVDSLGTMKKHSNFYQQYMTSTLMTDFDNAGATDGITVNSIDSNMNIDHRIRLFLSEAKAVAFKPTTIIKGMTTVNGTALECNQLGAHLELRFKGDAWEIVSMRGTWA